MPAPQPKKVEEIEEKAAEETAPAETAWDAQFRQMKIQFMNRAQERVEAIDLLLTRLQANSADNQSLRQIMQHFHWIAGSSGTYGLEEISQWGIYGEELCEYILKLQAPVSDYDLNRLATALNTVMYLFEQSQV